MERASSRRLRHRSCSGIRCFCARRPETKRPNRFQPFKIESSKSLYTYRATALVVGIGKVERKRLASAAIRRREDAAGGGKAVGRVLILRRGFHQVAGLLRRVRQLHPSKSFHRTLLTNIAVSTRVRRRVAGRTGQRLGLNPENLPIKQKQSRRLGLFLFLPGRRRPCWRNV